MANGDASAGYTIKEMLAQIQDDIRDIDRKLDTKADVQSIVDARARLTALERELDRREGTMQRIEEKADKVYVNGVKEKVDELEDKVTSLTRALYTASLSVVGAVLIFLIQQGGFR